MVATFTAWSNLINSSSEHGELDFGKLRVFTDIGIIYLGLSNVWTVVCNLLWSFALSASRSVQALIH